MILVISGRSPGTKRDNKKPPRERSHLASMLDNTCIDPIIPEPIDRVEVCVSTDIRSSSLRSNPQELTTTQRSMGMSITFFRTR